MIKIDKFKKEVFMRKGIYFIVFFLFLCLLGFANEAEIKAHYELSRFLPPEVCGGCHSDIFTQWKGSLHQLSLKDKIFLAVAKDGLKGIKIDDELLEAESCQKCHTPVGYLSGYPLRTSDDIKKIQEPATQGVQCDYCHSITGAYAIYNAKYRMDPGNGYSDPGIKRGPFNDSKADFHKTEFSSFHTKSEICGTCHNVKHVVYGTWLETTYEEWSASPYKNQGIQCQDCHMYQRPGHPATGSTKREKNPGIAAYGGPQRDHIFTHYFVGGNSVIPATEKDNIRVKMAEDRLQNAVTMSIEEKMKGNSVVIKLLNNGAGHEVPTGVSNIRQVWLKVIVKDSTGKVVYSSGVPDKKGYIDSRTIIFGTVFGDGNGNRVDNLAKAKEILFDKRLKPMKEHFEHITIKSDDTKFTVEAELIYSIISQKTADSLKELKGLKIKPVVMTQAKATVIR